MSCVLCCGGDVGREGCAVVFGAVCSEREIPCTIIFIDTPGPSGTMYVAGRFLIIRKNDLMTGI
jgi:hypothetical protein